MSASGVCVRPVIFAYKGIREDLAGDPTETFTVCSDFGYGTPVLFMEHTCRFPEEIVASTNHSVSLLLDGHSAHVSPEAIR